MIGFVEFAAALGVADETGIDEGLNLGKTDLACMRAGRVAGDILGGNLDLGAEIL